MGTPRHRADRFRAATSGDFTAECATPAGDRVASGESEQDRGLLASLLFEQKRSASHKPGYHALHERRGNGLRSARPDGSRRPTLNQPTTGQLRATLDNIQLDLNSPEPDAAHRAVVGHASLLWESSCSVLATG
jgi:hypothetical protein